MMAVSEQSRHDLIERLRVVGGEEHAETLMDLLPPVGWADVARRQDLDHLEASLGHRIDALGHRFDADLARLEVSLQRELRQTLLAMLGALFTMTGIILALG